MLENTQDIERWWFQQTLVWADNGVAWTISEQLAAPLGSTYSSDRSPLL